MRKKLLKGFAWALLCGFLGVIFILLATYPDVPEGSFYNINNWTPMEWVFSVPVAVMTLSLIAIVVLGVTSVFRKESK